MKILFVTVHSSSFTKGDFEILSRKHFVTNCDFSTGNVSFLKLFKLVRQHDLIFFWFVSLRFLKPLFLSKLLGRKVIFVAGGYDVANVEELNYGSMSTGWKSIIIKYMIRLSDKILSVSNSNYREIIANCKTDPAKIEMIYHGLKPVGTFDLDRKEDRVITIGFIDEASFYRKGIDRFLKLASHMGNINFHLIGRIDMDLNNVIIPGNVQTHGYLERSEVEKMLSISKIYVQLSRHEAFGYSVAEAMQFGCIPVVSNCYSLPEVVGDTGLILNNAENYEEIAEKLMDMLNNYNRTTALRCIDRISKFFTIDERSRKILNIVESIN